MRLSHLQTLNYRNLEDATVDFLPGLNVITGPNGQGKTNLLEAIYLVLTGFTEAGRLEQLVRFGQKEAYVKATLEREDGHSVLEVGIGRGRRVQKADGLKVSAGALLRGGAVWIRPEDSELILGSPGGRRAFLDALLSKLSLRYASILALYERNLAQRNASLRSGELWALEVWNTKLSELGAEILTLRRRAVTRLSELAQNFHTGLGGGEDLELKLLETTTPETYLLDLQAKRSEEVARGLTVLGPHRDDLEIVLHGVSAHTYASRGEARTIALALRQAEYTLLEERHGDTPILLLDDFSAELDPSRRQHLLSLALKSPQAIVTGTESPDAPEGSLEGVKRHFTVFGGKLALEGRE